MTSAYTEEMTERSVQALKALEKAKIMENEAVKNGFRFVRVDAHTQVLVECGVDGKPTECGRQQIQRFLNNL